MSFLVSRGRPLVALLGAATALLATAPTAFAATARGCSPRGSEAIVATGSARVYALPGKPDRRIFGCLNSVGRPVALGKELGSDLGGIELDSVQLAGRYVAFTVSDCGLNCGEALNVYDLSRRRKTISQPAVPAAQARDEQEVTDLVLGGQGAVAWIGQAEAEDDPGPSFRAVYAVDAAGKRTLDTGLEIVSGSLALSGRTVYWLKGRTPVAGTLR